VTELAAERSRVHSMADAVAQKESTLQREKQRMQAATTEKLQA
jgi:hypothetical protein